jgi:hypothetical protein
MSFLLLGLIVMNSFAALGAIGNVEYGRKRAKELEYAGCKNSKDSLMVDMKQSYKVTQDSIRKSNKIQKQSHDNSE